MENKTLIFICCLLILLNSNCFAQSESKILVIGSLIEKTSKKPLDFLTVALNDTIHSSITDEGGLFILDVPKIGSYKLTVKNLGVILLDTVVQIDKSQFDLTIGVHIKCNEYSKLKAIKDIESGNPTLLLNGGFAPAYYSTDEGFEKKYKVKYLQLGDIIHDNPMCLEEYNKVVFTYLDQKFGSEWRKEVRNDLITNQDQ